MTITKPVRIDIETLDLAEDVALLVSLDEQKIVSRNEIIKRVLKEGLVDTKKKLEKQKK